VQGCGLDVSGSRHDPAAGPCEQDNESWCFIEDREVLGQVVASQRLKRILFHGGACICWYVA